MKSLLKPSFLITLFLFLFVVSCAKEDGTQEATEATQIVPEATAVSESTPTHTPQATQPATPTIEPTPLVPYIDGENQELNDDGELFFPRVVSTQSGWLVVYNEGDGQLGDVLGYTAVSTGINNDLTVNIDPMEATQTIIALLHIDGAPKGEFNFPDGADTTLEYETAVIAIPIELDFQISQPDITVSNQDIREDGLLTVDNVLSPISGWLVIHANKSGELGKVLGSTLLEEGLNEELVIHIPWRDGTPTLYAVIYEDNGRLQQLDIPSEDTPLVANGNPVIEAFTATYPPDIYVLDQPIVDATFEVERVISNGPGYLVAYYDNEGVPGLIIGSKALEDGLNENVKVVILETAVTPILHLRLHEDTEPGDGFDFPRVDQPIIYDDRLPTAVIFNNEPGNYLITANQQLNISGENAIIHVPYAVVEVPAWLVIHADDEGQRGKILGMSQLDVGLNRDLEIEILAEEATDTLYAVLYLDAEELGEFEYPDGDDIPLQRSRQILQAPFQIIPAEE